MENNTVTFTLPLTCTDRKHTARYEVSAETLAGLVFNPDAPAPIVEVVERHSGLSDRPFTAFYEATEVEPDADEIENGSMWYLVGEAGGRKVWLSLRYNNPPEPEEAGE
jgi:hypothetical protein